MPLKRCLPLSVSCLDPEYYSITRAAFTRAYRLVIISLREADVIGHMFSSWLNIHCSLREAASCFNKCSAVCCHSASGPQLVESSWPTNSSALWGTEDCSAAFAMTEQKKQQSKTETRALAYVQGYSRRAVFARRQLETAVKEQKVAASSGHTGGKCEAYATPCVASTAQHSKRLPLVRDEVTHHASWGK